MLVILLVLTSSEDVYIENIIADIHERPKCRDYSEDKEFLTFLSMKIAELIEIQPDYHMSPGQCCAFVSKLHNDTMIIDITKEFEYLKRRAGDEGGFMSYVNPLQEVITKNIIVLVAP